MMLPSFLTMKFINFLGDIKTIKMQVFFENELFNMCIMLCTAYLFMYTVYRDTFLFDL